MAIVAVTAGLEGAWRNRKIRLHRQPGDGRARLIVHSHSTHHRGGTCHALRNGAGSGVTAQVCRVQNGPARARNLYQKA